MKKSLIHKYLRKYETAIIWSKSKKTCVEVTALKGDTRIDIRCNPDLEVEYTREREDAYYQLEADRNFYKANKKDIDIAGYLN